MYTTSIFSTSSGEPHRSPRRATETPHRLLAAPLVVYDFRPILHQNGRSRENPFDTLVIIDTMAHPGGFRPLVLAPQHYKVMLHWDGRGRRSDPGRAHELVLGGHDPVLRYGWGGGAGTQSQRATHTGDSTKRGAGGGSGMREGRQRTLTEGLSAGRAPARAKRSS